MAENKRPNLKRKITFAIITTAVFVGLNWLHDLTENSNFGCLTNGFISLCDDRLMSCVRHLTWYATIILFLIMTVLYVLECINNSEVDSKW